MTDTPRFSAGIRGPLSSNLPRIRPRLGLLAGLAGLGTCLPTPANGGATVVTLCIGDSGHCGDGADSQVMGRHGGVTMMRCHSRRKEFLELVKVVIWKNMLARSIGIFPFCL